MSTINAQSVGQRFEEEVKRLGGAAQVAGWLDVSRNTIYNWYKSAEFSGGDLAQLAERGMDALYVLTGNRNILELQNAAIASASGTMDKLTAYMGLDVASRFPVLVGDQQYFVSPADYRWIPFFDVEIAGGGGRVVDFASPPKKFNAYRKDYLANAGLLDAELFEATVVNDSMIPEIQPSEVILVNASDKVIVSGDVYVVAMGEEWICKYLRRLPGETIEVYSANAEVHKPFTIRDGEIGNGVEIIGKVYRQGRDRVRR